MVGFRFHDALSQFNTIYLRHVLSLSLIPATTRPGPVLRLSHQAPLDRIIMTVLDLLNHNFRRSTIVIVTPNLPEDKSTFTAPPHLKMGDIGTIFTQRKGPVDKVNFVVIASGDGPP